MISYCFSWISVAQKLRYTMSSVQKFVLFHFHNPNFCGNSSMLQDFFTRDILQRLGACVIK
ncbi:bro [Trichoplusia ni granulovirus LBIV-12]|uniref:Bro n=1 Tax=Trichoplusia ni granulovirus LBIV-12 TaxID=1916701 RepID=A0A1D8QLE3_GVTN|nr:bro [Trichoplusia ni granulovirus LBIV-12]AOW41464.1 bro [Trichoplusia ni granulovirus LBIV-12]